jgi:VIT1/CCC1 family predicted Fe2+/Mn2+ transporter
VGAVSLLATYFTSGLQRNSPRDNATAQYGRWGVRASISRPEVHLSHRSNWLRAAVLGANDGILSIASLVLGVAASGASGAAIVTAGSAGLVAGALSMAAGEYVSVSSQRDSEHADIDLEERELGRDPDGELLELAGIYEQRGLSPALASEVAQALVAPRRRARGAYPRRAGT